jgi:hypothetical protein
VTCYASCVDAKSRGESTGVTSICPSTDPTQDFTAYCDQDGGLWNFPFWKGGVSTWGVGGGDYRWECIDDYLPETNGYGHTTLHQVWVRIAE